MRRPPSSQPPAQQGPGQSTNTPAYNQPHHHHTTIPLQQPHPAQQQQLQRPPNAGTRARAATVGGPNAGIPIEALTRGTAAAHAGTPVALPSLHANDRQGPHTQAHGASGETASRRPASKSSRAASSPAALTDPAQLPGGDRDLDPLAPLLQIPVIGTSHSEDYVHAVIWRVGRQFGFQAFSMNPATRSLKRQQYVASTCLLASDHVCRLLKNVMLRDKASLTEDERLARAVWSLHGTVFSAYEDTWCPKVGLKPRPGKMEEQARSAFTEPHLVHGLLCELALYFLMYTEGANLRFLYWCAAHSGHMEALWEAGPPPAVPNARPCRVAIRNALQGDISLLQAQFQHDPAAPGITPADCFRALAFISGKVPPPPSDKMAAIASADPPDRLGPLAGGAPAHTHPHHYHHKKSGGGPGGLSEGLRWAPGGDMAGLLEDLVALGDGGWWLERVLTPIFYVMSYEMDHLYTAGVEVAFRLGYDDVSESLSYRPIVAATLRLLGVSPEELRAGAVHGGHEAITRLGLPDPQGPHAQPGGWDSAKAAAFWSAKVFTKTYRERRSWGAAYRAFYRVYALHILLFHLLTVYSWVGPDPDLLSTVSITHAFLHFAERLCNWWMARPQVNPLDANTAKGAWVKTGAARTPAGKKGGDKGGQPGDAEHQGGPAGGSSPSDSPRDPLAQAAQERQWKLRPEGAPVWGVLGLIEWLLIAIGLLVLFVAQFIPATLLPGASTLGRAYWGLASGGYLALMAGHALLTTRDGYSVSLTSLLRLPAAFTCSSARPNDTCWMRGDLKIGWKNWLSLVGFWACVLGIKIAFDYFVLIAPMVEPTRMLLQRGWLGCTTDYYTVFGTQLPLLCIDADWVLVFVRNVPYIIVCFFDTHTFYQVVVVVWGFLRGLTSLNIGMVAEWEALVTEFHRGPMHWWSKVMSERGNTARLSLVALKRAQATTAGLSPRGRNSSVGVDLSGAGGTDNDTDSPGVTGFTSSSAASSDNEGPGHHTPSLMGLTQGALLEATRERLSSQGNMALGGAGMMTYSSLAGGRKKRAGSGGKGGKGSTGGKGSSGKGGKGGKSGAELTDLHLMLENKTDEQVAMWDSFASAWDEVVADLREADLISNREADNLRFTRLCYDAGLEVSGVRPLLLPAFFYAGALQRICDTGLVTTQQALVASEARTLLVWLGSHLGLLGAEAVRSLMVASFVPEAIDLVHSQSREKLMRAAVRLLGAVSEVGFSCQTPQDLRRRQGLHAEAALALCDLLSCVEVECQAVRAVAGGSDAPRGAGSKKNKWCLGASEVGAAEALLHNARQMREALERDPTPISACLRALHDQEEQQEAAGKSGAGGGMCGSFLSAGDSSSATSAMAGACDAQMAQKVVSVLLKMLTLAPAAAKPESEDARRVLTFFMSTLANRQLSKPVALDEMLSWSVLTPCYEEDVLYPLRADLAAAALGAGEAPSPAATAAAMEKTAKKHGTAASAAMAALAAAYSGAGGASGMADLLTETEDRVSLMAFLRSVFPTDWENLKERLGERLGVSLEGVSEEAFAPGGPLSDLGLELQLWASFRGQLLARTVRGMMCYEKALRVLARLENPCPPGLPRSQYDAWVDDIVATKFQYVVSSQVYGKNRTARDVRSRWLAEGVDVLLEVFDKLQIAFLDSGALGLPGRGGGAGAGAQTTAQFSVLIQGRRGAPAAWEVGEYVSGQRVEEVYRVRLPLNRYSGRGVILGEGKPENQNHAIIFALNEGMMTIDMNQDNNLAEAFKLRNLLGELQPEVTDARAVAAPLALGSHASGSDMRVALTRKRAAERPVAIVGFCEHIFSDKSGALGSFAASAEFAFGTIVQRTMDVPGRVRMHYGHPDLMNKLFIMGRGGPSKATRQLHISEDIFGGYNHTLRGGRIKYREYISVGKGRDMGFDSINAFEIKISGGAGEVLISRDLYRLSARFDFFRLLHFYFSGMGYYINTWAIMSSVYAQSFALVLFALAGADAIYTETTDTSMQALNPNAPSVQKVTMYDTLKTQSILQLGMLSLVPYLAELVLEHGLVRTLAVFLQQVLAGSYSFFIFKQQTTSFYFQDDMTHGGAQYIGTGRGFSLTTSQFLKIWTNYSRSHIYPGVELLSLAFLMLFVNNCADCNIGALTWGTWLVGASLVFAPFWFNPLSFSTTKVKRDIAAWGAWLRGEVDPTTGTSWSTWNRKQLSRIRNDRGNQPSHWGNVVLALVVQCCPLLLLTLAAVSRLEVGLTLGLPPLLQSRYIVFLIATALIWSALGATLWAAARFRAKASQRSWRLYTFWTATICTALAVVYLAALSRWLYSGSGWANLGLVLYANLNLVAVAHRAATHLCTGSSSARSMVDFGFLLMDSLIGYSLLTLLALLSFSGVVGWLQALLLFNPTFAKSVRRGQLVRTIGLAKADGATTSHPHAAAIEGAVGAAAAASRPAPTVPRSRGVSLVNARMQASSARSFVDDAIPI